MKPFPDYGQIPTAIATGKLEDSGAPRCGLPAGQKS
jgi:hypothetical protein